MRTSKQVGDPQFKAGILNGKGVIDFDSEDISLGKQKRCEEYVQ